MEPQEDPPTRRGKPHYEKTCFLCGSDGHKRRHCPKGKAGKKRGDSSLVAKAVERENERDDAEQQEISKLGFELELAEVRIAEMELLMVKLNEPFEKTINMIQQNAELLDEALQCAPWRGLYSAAGMLLRVGDLRECQQLKPLKKDELPTPPQELEDIATYIREIICNKGDLQKQKFPVSFDEHMYVRFEEYGLAKQIAKVAGYAAAAVYAATFAKSWRSRVSAMGKAHLTGRLVDGVVDSFGDEVLLKIRHHFSFERLPQAEQAQLSQDQRNLSFLKAKGIATSYGYRISHSVELFYIEKTWTDIFRDAQKNVALKTTGLMPLMDFMVAKGWMDAATPATMVRSLQNPRTDLPWIPVQPGTIISLTTQTPSHPQDLSFQVPEGPISPARLRASLQRTLPSMDGQTCCGTYISWMRTHPRFMDSSRQFEDVKKFLQLAYCSNGQIVNNLRSGRFDSLYAASSQVALITWLSLRSDMGAQLCMTQDWGF